MNVVAVQQHFRSIASLVEQTGAAKKVIENLNEIADGLEYFRDRSLTEFIDFLRKAEEYDRTGKVTVTHSKKTTRTKPQPKIKGPPPQEVVQLITNLYNNVIDKSITEESINSDLELLKSLKKNDLQQIANNIDIGAKVRRFKVAEMIDAIKKAILHRRGMFDRPDY